MIIPKNWSTMKKLMFLQQTGGGSVVIEDTASGNPVVFTTELAKPLKSLALSLLPRQSGTGDPSPQNIRSLIPWGEVGTWHTGVNVWDEEWESGNINFSTGAKQNSSVNIRSKNYIPIVGGETYYGKASTLTSSACVIFFYTEDKTYISNAYCGNTTFTVPSDAKYALFYCGSAYGTTYNHDISINYPSTDTEYHPYTGQSHPVNVGNITPPVYGASIDLTTGEVWGTWAFVELNGTEANWNNYNQGTAFSLPITGMTTDKYKSVFCDRFAQIKNITSFGVYASASNYYAYFINATDIEGVTDLASWKAYLAENPMGFAYQLATPVLLATLTPQQINALVGVNTVWSDADNIDLTFLKKR